MIFQQVRFKLLLYSVIRKILVCISLLTLFFPEPIFSNDNKIIKDILLPRYCPPKRKNHSARIVSGMRGDNEKLPVCTVLAPEDFGITINASPVLYWYISKLWNKKIIFAVNNIESMKTIFEHKIIVKKIGIQKIDLSKYNVNLEYNKQYEWNIALICNQNQPSQDITTGGIIIRKKISQKLQEKLKITGKMRHYIFAEEGIWYEAIHAISSLIESDPNNFFYRNQRAYLFDQVNLREAAEYDRNLKNE